MGHTFHVLNAEFLYHYGRENTRRKGTTEDIAEFGVESTDTHIFELEVRRKDCIRRRSECLLD
jgi:hypothetical protein